MSDLFGTSQDLSQVEANLKMAENLLDLSVSINALLSLLVLKEVIAVDEYTTAKETLKGVSPYDTEYEQLKLGYDAIKAFKEDNDDIDSIMQALFKFKDLGGSDDK